MQEFINNLMNFFFLIILFGLSYIMLQTAPQGKLCFKFEKVEQNYP